MISGGSETKENAVYRRPGAIVEVISLLLLAVLGVEVFEAGEVGEEG